MVNILYGMMMGRRRKKKPMMMGMNVNVMMKMTGAMTMIGK
ncbi:MAG: hypothetical protein NZ735_07810 [Candidatus Marinimicrobia bacterium]|nr:hypothetical protein [Candidatus Neomarinimicrobiota bacterium]